MFVESFGAGVDVGFVLIYGFYGLLVESLEVEGELRDLSSSEGVLLLQFVEGLVEVLLDCLDFLVKRLDELLLFGVVVVQCIV